VTNLFVILKCDHTYNIQQKYYNTITYYNKTFNQAVKLRCCCFLCNVHQIKVVLCTISQNCIFVLGGHFKTPLPNLLQIPHTIYKSPLPLTDPRDAMPHAHRVVHTYRQSV